MATKVPGLAKPGLSMARAAGATYAVLAAADAALAGRGTARAGRLRMVTKPLLMPALGTAFGATTATRRPGTNLLRGGMLSAQALSGIGDVALLAPGRAAFLTGLTSFLGAHVCYTFAFATAPEGASQAPQPARRLRGWTGVATAATTFLCLGPAMSRRAARHDPALRLPVLVYVGAIMCMFAAATRLPRSLPRRARRRVVAGSAFFVLSDTVLAARQFVLCDPAPWTGTAVMATYCLGQGMIAAGVEEALRDRSAARSGHSGHRSGTASS